VAGIIPALGSQKQKDHKFEDSISYIYIKTVSKRKKEKKKTLTHIRSQRAQNVRQQ
jgi:hypothetical protein